jgi:hypothetical protein
MRPPSHGNDKDTRVADRLLPIFPTNILQRRLEGMEEVNRQLEALAMQIAASEPNSTTGTTTEGGFQTKEDLFQRDNPGIAALRPHIISAMQDYAGLLVRQELTRPPQKIDFVLWGWAVIYKAGHSQGVINIKTSGKTDHATRTLVVKAEGNVNGVAYVEYSALFPMTVKDAPPAPAKAEVKKPEAKKEAAKPEAKKVDAPKPEVKKEEKKPEAPKADAKKVEEKKDPAKPDAKKVDSEKKDSPKPDAPKPPAAQ